MSLTLFAGFVLIGSLGFVAGAVWTSFVKVGNQ